MTTNDQQKQPPRRKSLWRRLYGLSRYRYGIVVVLIALALFLGVGAAETQTIPTISIVSVTADQNVTIQTHNFPRAYIFTVTMGPMGTKGVGGIVVGTIDSSRGDGQFTFNIPDQLKGSYQIAIRTQTSHANPFFSYNWFFNNTTNPQPGPGTGGEPDYSGIPTFRITGVTRDQNVTIETNNFPRGQVFTVTMGAFGTQGIGGIVVGTLDSGNGGTLTATFNIPAQLAGSNRIAIRAQTSHANPFFAYNWFFNNTTGTGGQPTATAVPTMTTTPPPPTVTPSPTSPGTGGQPTATATAVPQPPPPPYTGIPTFTVCSVVRNDTVTIMPHNFPSGQIFTVTMGPFGTQGIGGYVVGTIDTSQPSIGRYTFNIPDQLDNSYRIAIRAQTSHANPFFAYNWFYNTTATVC